MLTKRRCTATGVINFFSMHEPHIAVGSVVKRDTRSAYVWHYHGTTGSAGGTASDLAGAERAIGRHHRQAMASEGDDRYAA